MVHVNNNELPFDVQPITEHLYAARPIFLNQFLIHTIEKYNIIDSHFTAV